MNRIMNPTLPGWFEESKMQFLIFVLNTLVLKDLHTEVGKQFHKKGAEYANDFLNSSVLCNNWYDVTLI